ncbi:Os09g0463800, partial [Oryza sativa Japonica Group]
RLFLVSQLARLSPLSLSLLPLSLSLSLSLVVPAQRKRQRRRWPRPPLRQIQRRRRAPHGRRRPAVAAVPSPPRIRREGRRRAPWPPAGTPTSGAAGSRLPDPARGEHVVEAVGSRRAPTPAAAWRRQLRRTSAAAAAAPCPCGDGGRGGEGHRWRM